MSGDAASPMSKSSRFVDGSVYKTLLESTKAIPWKIDWPTATFAYIGPQIEELLGWTPESWQTVQDWAARMHPDDQKWVVDFCVAQSKSGIDHEADYRAMTKDGKYVWIRDVVHVVRDDEGNVLSLIGFMFDISERKRTEEQLLKLQRELEDLSYRDGLTSVANRRHFDNQFEIEWKSARRNKAPLSLALIDIDFFKQYNDTYGHVRGDECLKRVAKTLGAKVSRPRDMLSRFGGEEFALLLPETDAPGAAHIAKQCLEAISGEQIAHDRSEAAKIVTISVGVGTIVPSPDDDLTRFLDEVDQCLYRAKQSGRNRVIARK